MTSPAERPRIALVTPAPPAASGIVDAVEELLPCLREQFHVELYLDDPAIRAGRWEGRHSLCLGRDLRRAGDLLPLYQVGNHASCRFLLPLAYRHPGVLVLHDLGLHHSLAQFFLEGGQERDYLDEMRYSHGEEGATAARVINSGFYSEALYRRFPLFAGLVSRSRAVIVHSRWAERQVQSACPTTPVFLAPLHSGLTHLPSDAAASRAEARARLGLPSSAFVVGTVGNLIASRRLESCLEAFRTHRESFPASLYLLAGEEWADLGALVSRLGLEGSVIRLGRVSLPDFHAAIAACDLLCNLRYPSLGETSGSLIRILGMGRVALVSNLEQFLEFPSSFCPRVDVDDREVSQLEAHFRWFATHPADLAALGEAAARHVLLGHQPPAAAAAYERAVRAAQTARPSREEPAWCDPLPVFHRSIFQATGQPSSGLDVLLRELLGQPSGSA